MSAIDFSTLTIGDTVVESEIPLSRASLLGLDLRGSRGHPHGKDPFREC